MKDFFSELIKALLMAALIVIPIRTFLFQPFLVQGASMEPNYHQGDYLIVDQLSYRFREPKRGEVIVFYSPIPPKRRFIKRIVGLPGETVSLQDGNLYVKENGKKKLLNESSYLNQEVEGNFKVSIPKDEYFMMGDNRDASLDSRSWGTLPEEKIIGRVLIHLSPFSALKNLKTYLNINYA